MVDREQFAKALEEIRDLRAALAAERFLHDRLRDQVKARGDAAGEIAAMALRESRGVATQTWQRASAEQAVALTILRSA
jgi:hypothetical protein